MKFFSKTFIKFIFFLWKRLLNQKWNSCLHYQRQILKSLKMRKVVYKKLQVCLNQKNLIRVLNNFLNYYQKNSNYLIHFLNNLCCYLKILCQTWKHYMTQFLNHTQQFESQVLKILNYYQNQNYHYLVFLLCSGILQQEQLPLEHF